MMEAQILELKEEVAQLERTVEMLDDSEGSTYIGVFAPSCGLSMNSARILTMTDMKPPLSRPKFERTARLNDNTRTRATLDDLVEFCKKA